MTNKSAPEGCIAEAYLASECVTYTKMYLDASESSNQHKPVDQGQFNLSIISTEVQVYGRMSGCELEPYELGIAHWWILLNCPEVQYWKDIHLTCEGVRGDIKFHNNTFADYFGEWVRIHAMIYMICDSL